MNIFGGIASPEPPAQPERVQVIVIPVERDTQRIVEHRERLVRPHGDRPAHPGPAVQPRAEHESLCLSITPPSVAVATRRYPWGWTESREDRGTRCRSNFASVTRPGGNAV